MKKFILFIVFLSLNIAFADNFQIKYIEENYIYKVSYSEVIIEKDGREVFRGHTNKNGKITINLEPGNYICRVNYRRTWMIADINIDHSDHLKIIYIRTEG